MLQTERKKQMKLKESFVQFPCSLPELWSVNCLKKCTFCNFVLTAARNLSLLKQLTYMHLKRLLLRTFRKWYCLLGITKPCTHLHPAPSTSTQLIPSSTQPHPPPPSSFQPPPSSQPHPQQYLNQNIARDWAISPNLAQKLKVVYFY